MIRLHHIAFSRSFRVLWLLEELGLDHELVSHPLLGKSLRNPEFLKVSPAGRVPALEIDGMTLCESGAIVQYLCERHPEAGLAPPPGAPERARYLEALGYSETMASLVEFLNVQHLFLRDPDDASPSTMKITTARLKSVMRGLEAMLEERDHLLGGFSAADVMMGFTLFAAPYFVRLDEFPRLAAYKARLEARDGFRRAQVRDGEQQFYAREFYPVPEG